MKSIRKKINLGFYALAGTLAVVAVFALTDLHYLEQRLKLELTVSDFVDAVLELRRYEKNYLLYGAEDDFREVRTYGQKATQLLNNHNSELSRLIGSTEIARLHHNLSQHQRLFAELEAIPAQSRLTQRHALEPHIRDSGRIVAEGAEAIAKAQRREILIAVKRSRIALPVAITVVGLLGVIIAQRASKAAVTPLGQLQNDLEDIGRGQFDRLTPPSNDREIVSVAAAVNHMLNEIETRRRHLVQSEKLASLGTLVAGVAHELNNPLSNVSSSCQLLLEELDTADFQQLREWLGQIDDETARARHIVRTLLEFSTERAFAKRTTSLRLLIDKSLFLLGRQTTVRQHIDVDIPEELMVDVDEQRMQQVCVNLLRNALDAGGNDVNIRVNARIVQTQALQLPRGSVYAQEPSPSVAETLVLLNVTDNGPGIPKEVLRRVFDPFFTTKDIGRGSGLGLFVTQEIVDQHDGFIAVHSQPNMGTTFFIGLPYHPDENST